MPPPDLAAARARMVERQLRRRGISDERVLQAMARVPRELFVPEELRVYAYDDEALPIGERQTISQPFVVATICALLALDGPERVLDVGTGSGYQAAVLAELAEEVVTIERIAGLAETARTALAAAGYRNVEVRVGDGSLGVPELAPFDGIAVAAAAPIVRPARHAGAPGARARRADAGGAGRARCAARALRSVARRRRVRRELTVWVVVTIRRPTTLR
jgi:protein-L-isoaspartate(D-aspartate) O-methyltransferase